MISFVKRYLTVKEAAERARVSEMTIRRWYMTEGLPVHQRKHGCKVLIKPVDLRDFITQRQS